MIKRSFITVSMLFLSYFLFAGEPTVALTIEPTVVPTVVPPVDNALTDEQILLVSNDGSITSDCKCKGIPLYGKVKVVTSFADFDVRVVTSSWADIEVQKVETYPDKCGKWKFVDSFPDFTIRYVASPFADFDIKFVNSSPGVK